MHANTEIERRIKKFGAKYEDLVKQQLVCDHCARGVGKTWRRGDEVLCFICYHAPADGIRVAGIQAPIALTTGQEVNVFQLMKAASLNYLDAAKVLVQLKEDGILHRLGPLRYRVMDDVEIVPQEIYCNE